MKILLDENLDHRLVGMLEGHEVDHVRLIGWSGFQNGELMGLIGQLEYDVFITADKQLIHQQNIKSVAFGVVVLDVHPNKLSSYAECILEVREAVLGAKPGVVSSVRWPR